MKNGRLLSISLLAVIIIFHVCYGLQILIPTNISWLMTAMHDWGTHYLGWYFYKGENWHFPLGHVTNYFYPIGTNVGFTDSIPLFAVFFKVFAPILPEDFQYFGIFLLSCHILAAYYTIKLLNLFHIEAIYIFLAVVIIASNPVLVYRGLHPALCAHWLLLASVYIYFLDPASIKPSKILFYQFVLLMISALINPYLCFMVLGFTFFTALRLTFFDRVQTKISFFAYLAGSVFFLLFVWFVIGMITIGKKEDLGVSGGYGLYSLNLNSLYNPSGFSSFLPQLKQVSWHQYEGFMYLGAGVIGLIVIWVGYWIYGLVKPRSAGKRFIINIKWKNISLIPLLLLVFLFTLFAITHIISLNDTVLLQIPIPESFIKFGEIFRASARFFWLPYYLIVLFVLVAIAGSQMHSNVKIVLLAVALTIQLYDIKHLLLGRNLTYGSYQPPVQHEHWEKIMQGFDQVLFYPPFQATYLTNLDYQYFSFLAARQRKPINIGYVARADNKAIAMYTDSLNSELLQDSISSDKLYITTASYLKIFSYLVQSDIMQLNMLDNYYYLFSKNINKADILALSDHLNRNNKASIDSSFAALSSMPVFREVSKIDIGNREVIRYNLESLTDEEKYVSLNGWAFNINTDNNKGDSVFVFLKSEDKFYLATPDVVLRPDVTGYFNKSNLEDAGFNGIILKKNVKKGNYALGIAIKSKQGAWLYQLTDKTIKAAFKDYTIAEPVSKITVSGESPRYGLDKFEVNNKFIEISGWAFLKNQNTANCQISVVIQNTIKTFVSDTEQTVTRPDVTAHFNNGYNLDYSGFNAKILKSTLPKGKYQVAIYIKDTSSKTEGIVVTDREINI